ncbi:hypothetical protein A3860_11710 [Niastella vici]|uniref:Iron dicitrate transport regulator FecR n=1 Tax=Niastella vici TaxID=1703345 RepID=A0A1V9FFT2_9BACT|nr:FecR family protein [Niastella vici]OQP57219.1 hypothetical protein A3860_11710 [Niastella vici]
MSVDRLTILWEKYLADNMSAEERTEFKILGADPACQKKLEELMLSVFENEPFAATNDLEKDRELIFQEIMMKAGNEQAPVKKLKPAYRILRWSPAAAAVLLLMVVSWFWISRRENTRSVVAVTAPADIAPGKDGAILTLANGSQVLLDSIKSGVVALQGGATAKIVNGSLVYESTGAGWVYNTVSTPRGRHFHLTLPDGSEVWLNSISSVRYPTSFTGAKRAISITGEAYFEVAHNAKMPFIVNVDDKASVEVLGTHFNVNAYENEAGIKTTLLEGRVKVVKRETGKEESGILKPGEQAVLASHSPLIIDHSPNLEQVMAWKNGLFNFEDLSLKEAMKQLERWYDIDVVYEGAIPEIYFTGKMNRDIPLSGVLKLLEDAKVHFRMEGNRRLVVIQ